MNDDSIGFKEIIIFIVHKSGLEYLLETLRRISLHEWTNKF